MKKYIIIGSSAAGIGALARLRQLDPAASITCVSQSPEMPYNTCLLADMLAGTRSRESVHTKRQDFFEQNNIALRLDAEVMAIDPVALVITLAGGEQLSYDALFLGVGTVATLPPIAGARDLTGVFSYHTLTDASLILNYCATRATRRAVVIGGGLSGLECADALLKRGIAVYLVERHERLLSLLCDEVGAGFVAAAAERCGVAVHTNESVASLIAEHGVVGGVQLAQGAVLDADMVIFATGSRPRLELARAAGLAVCDDGILVDEFMRTSNEHIFAGGDVACVPDAIAGGHVRNTTWPDAVRQGMCAAVSMAGQPAAYPGVVTVAGTRLFGVPLVSCGAVALPREGDRVLAQQTENSYRKYLVRDGRLAGFLLIGEVQNGEVQNAGALRALVASKKQVDDAFLTESSG